MRDRDKESMRGKGREKEKERRGEREEGWRKGAIFYITLHFIWQTVLSKATYKVVQIKVIKQPNIQIRYSSYRLG